MALKNPWKILKRWLKRLFRIKQEEEFRETMSKVDERGNPNHLLSYKQIKQKKKNRIRNKIARRSRRRNRA